MAGSVESGKKAAITNTKFDPDFYKTIGALGGANSRGYKFGHGKVSPQEAGRRGGLARTEAKKLAAQKAQRERRAKTNEG